MAESKRVPGITSENASGDNASVEKEAGEDALVASLRAGSPEALTATYLSYYDEMVDLARRYVHHPGAAEEIVQDTWAAVIEGLERFEGKCSFKTWTFRILVNKAKSRYRRESRFSAIKRWLGMRNQGDLPPRFDAAGSWARPVERWLETPEQKLLTEEFRREMDEFLASLPTRQLRVYVLRDVEA